MSNHNSVTNPKHYDLFPGQQSIDVIQASLTPEEFAGFCKGNALKYRLRAGEKGDAAEDLAKANWYRDRLWSESACNGKDPHPTISPETSATRSPDSKLAKG